MVKRIDSLTPEQMAQFEAHADKWIEVGLRTAPADRPRFEDAAKKCYEYAGIPWHGNVVWVSSPLVLAFAAPTAAFLISYLKIVECKKCGIRIGLTTAGRPDDPRSVRIACHAKTH